MPDVFVSYATPDKDTADAICAALERVGIKPWIAHRDNDPGISYGASIIGALRECRMFLLVYSEHAARSEFVLGEVENAKNFRKPVLPVRIQNHPLSDELRLYLSRIHWLDAFPDPFFKYKDRIVAAVQFQLGALDELDNPSPLRPSSTHRFAPNAIRPSSAFNAPTLNITPLKSANTAQPTLFLTVSAVVFYLSLAWLFFVAPFNAALGRTEYTLPEHLATWFLSLPIGLSLVSAAVAKIIPHFGSNTGKR